MWRSNKIHEDAMAQRFTTFHIFILNLQDAHGSISTRVPNDVTSSPKICRSRRSRNCMKPELGWTCKVAVEASCHALHQHVAAVRCLATWSEQRMSSMPWGSG